MTDRDPIPQTNKQALWEAKLAEVNTYKDRKGTPVDKGIRDTVIVFNLLGFSTEGSCEGCPDVPGELSPQVTIEYKEVHPNKKIEEAERNNKRLKGYITEFYLKHIPTINSFIRSRLVNDVIFVDAGEDDDYENNRDKFIVGPDEVTMENVTPAEMVERNKILKQRQEEMAAFTQFLKGIFFNREGK